MDSLERRSKDQVLQTSTTEHTVDDKKMGGIVPPPANGCCCNMYARTGSTHACNVCCGPPVFFAVRMLCIVNLVGLFLHTGNTGYSITSDDCCLAITKDTTLISTGIGALGNLALARSGSAVWRGLRALVLNARFDTVVE